MNDSVAKQIAADTWDRLEQSQIHDVRLGEETLTDLLTLDFVRRAPKGVKLYQKSKSEEARTGADLEILIEVDDKKYIAVVIQAKKLYSSGRYGHLNAKISGTNNYQIDILEEYSMQTQAIPLYLLYNFVEAAEKYYKYPENMPWCNCDMLENIKHLGCTLVPIWRIREAINTRGGRNFHSIHNISNLFPWHCLFNCKKNIGILSLIDHIKSKSLKDHFKSSWRERYDWLRLEPMENTGFDYLWSRGINISNISDEEWDTEEWDTKRYVSILQEADIEDFYRNRGIDLHKLKFKVQPKKDKQATSLETINLVPHRFLLIKSE